MMAAFQNERRSIFLLNNESRPESGQLSRAVNVLQRLRPPIWVTEGRPVLMDGETAGFGDIV